jgi:hypothetical protein
LDKQVAVSFYVFKSNGKLEKTGTGGPKETSADIGFVSETRVVIVWSVLREISWTVY